MEGVVGGGEGGKRRCSRACVPFVRVKGQRAGVRAGSGREREALGVGGRRRKEGGRGACGQEEEEGGGKFIDKR